MVTKSRRPPPQVPAKTKRQPRKVDDKRARFIAEYLLTNHGTKSAIAAGFAPKSAHVTASNLLREPKVRAEIDRRRALMEKKLADRYEITADRIKRELALIGFSNMLDYGVVRDDGHFDVDLTATTRDQAAAIQALKTRRTVRRYVTEDDRDVEVEDVTTELKLASKREALVDLGKATGLFADGAEVQIPVRFIVERTERSRGKKFECDEEIIVEPSQ